MCIFFISSKVAYNLIFVSLRYRNLLIPNKQLALLNRVPTSTQLHPPPPSSTQLHPHPPSSFQPWFSSIHPHPDLCSTLNVIRTKVSHVIWQFPKFKPKNSKFSILTENWHIWYLGGANSESRLRFLKFQPQNLFLGKFGPKKSKLSILLEHWHTWYFEDADSHVDISFLNFQPWIHFWTNLAQKSQSCSFCLKISMKSISRMLILIRTLVFWISNPKSVFGQILAEKVKAVCFSWKLA